jgi:hypothetical protein
MVPELELGSGVLFGPDLKPVNPDLLQILIGSNVFKLRVQDPRIQIDPESDSTVRVYS